jgi:hypothetical protein
VAHRWVEDLAEAGAASGQFAHLGDFGVDAALVPNRRSTSWASSSRPCATSQCGLSCWKSMPVNIKIAGIAARPNISRQFWLDASP